MKKVIAREYKDITVYLVPDELYDEVISKFNNFKNLYDSSCRSIRRDEALELLNRVMDCPIEEPDDYFWIY